MADAGVWAVVFVILLFLVFFVLAILAFVFWVIMLVDTIQRKFKNENDKIVWILVIVLVGIVGAIIYYFIVKREDKHRGKEKKRK
jgi:uncharacterized membrane-anchored protein